jgi:hypothetical protein
MRFDQKQMSRVEYIVTLIRYKLDRFCKNEYIRESYPLSGSFPGRMAVISCLASRADPTTLVQAMNALAVFITALPWAGKCW